MDVSKNKKQTTGSGYKSGEGSSDSRYRVSPSATAKMATSPNRFRVENRHLPLIPLAYRPPNRGATARKVNPAFAEVGSSRDIEFHLDNSERAFQSYFCVSAKCEVDPKNWALA